MNRRPSRSLPLSSQHSCRYRTTSADTFYPTAQRKRRRFSFYFAVLLSVLAVLLLFNTAINRFVFVRHVGIPVAHLPASIDGVTLLQISDLKGAEFGTGQKGIASHLKGKRVDAVVLTGDMVSPQGNAEPFYDLLDSLREVLPEVPIWFISGDGDPEPVSVKYWAEGSCFASWVLGAVRHGARLLQAPVRLNQEGPGIWLIPGSDLSLDLSLEQERFHQLQYDALASGDEILNELARFHLAGLSGLETAQKEIKPEDLCVALLHAEDPGITEQFFEAAGSEIYGIDAVLSGHWLGGLIHIPCVGPLFIPSVNLPNSGLLPGNGYDGLSRKGSIWHYVSSGLGSRDQKYPSFFFRLANPPSVSLIQFYSSGV